MKRGFTLIELLVSIGIIAVLAGVISINLISPQIRYSVEVSRDVIISDIKNQQIRAMNSQNLGSGVPGNFGIYFEQDKYYLFKGSTFNINDPLNIEVPFSNGSIVSSINLPNNSIIFSTRSGEVVNFNQSLNSITISNQDSQSEISINKYGSITY